MTRKWREGRMRKEGREAKESEMEGENLKARQCSYLLTYSPNSHKGWDWIRTKLRAGNQELIDLPLCGRDSTTLDITHCLPESTSAVC